MSWISALKVIPWVDVIQATPALVKGARRLLRRSEQEAAQASDLGAEAPPQSLPEALQRLQTLEQELARQGRVQADSAALLESLAEQQARLVETVLALQRRNRLLGIALALALLAGAAWIWGPR